MGKPLIAQLRARLVEARSELRDIKQQMDVLEAQTMLTIEGKNETERKARLAIALAQDEQHTKLNVLFKSITTEIERIESQIETIKDERREREWAIRERLVAALERRGMQPDLHDSSFDEVLDDQLVEPEWVR